MTNTLSTRRIRVLSDLRTHGVQAGELIELLCCEAQTQLGRKHLY
jgi:hypothetical protein